KESVPAGGGVRQIIGDILFGSGANTLNIQAGATLGGLSEATGGNLAIEVATDPGSTAVVDITAPTNHVLTTLAVTTLHVGAGGTLEAEVDSSDAIGAGGVGGTPVFKATGAVNFDKGAEIGISLDNLQIAPKATYVFVQAGAGNLTLGAPASSMLITSPFLYSAAASSTTSSTTS